MKAVLILLAAILVLYLGYRTYRIRTLTRDLDKIINKNTVILDVRTAAEYKTGHIEGSVNIPLGRLHQGDIPLSNKAVIITCCSHGLRSVKAMKVLKSRGFTNVHNGGVWNDLQKIIWNSAAR